MDRCGLSSSDQQVDGDGDRGPPTTEQEQGEGEPDIVTASRSRRQNKPLDEVTTTAAATTTILIENDNDWDKGMPQQQVTQEEEDGDERDEDEESQKQEELSSLQTAPSSPRSVAPPAVPPSPPPLPRDDDDDGGDDSGMDTSNSSCNYYATRKRSNSRASAGAASTNSASSSTTAVSAATAPSTAAGSVSNNNNKEVEGQMLLLSGNYSHHSVNSQSSATTLDQSLYTACMSSENDNSEVSFGTAESAGAGAAAAAKGHHLNHLPTHDLHHEPIIEVPAEEPLDTNSHYAVLNFVMEDRIFLKAALDLLAERDRTAPELGMMDPIILKSGSLKKASHLMNGVWKVKYVEIRRGMFSYYENVGKTSSSSKKNNKDGSSSLRSGRSGRKSAGSGGGGGKSSGGGSGGGQLLRKDIPLVAQSCRCRAVKLHQKALKFTPTGAIFELSYGNNSKRLWMAKTRADRQVWMQAILNATVGGSVTRGQELFDPSTGMSTSSSDHRGVVWGISPRSPFRDDLRKYLKAHSILRNAKNKSDYVLGLRVLTDHSLKVPVKWIAKQQGLTENVDVAFREDAVDLSIDQLRKDLQRDSVTINGELFRGDAGHGPERIIGALARELMEVGRRSNSSNNEGIVGRSDFLQESQALAYARDILLSGNRTRSGGDSYFCVNTLCTNQELVVVVPGGREAEPVAIEVSEDESDVGFVSGVIEKSGWIKTRNKSQKEWRKLFFVLSEGTLSFYESATPRPHRLLGQIVLTDATVSVSKVEAASEKKVPAHFVMTLSKEGSTRDRYLLFSSEDRLLDWTYALECTTKMKANADAVRKSSRRRSLATDTPSSKLDIISQAEQSTKDHATNLGLADEIVENRIAGYARRTASTIVISIRAATEYNVCTTDPQGCEREDTWATIRAHFLQSFRVNGGPNGRILRGEEIVRVSVVDCIDDGQEPQELPDDPGTPPRRARDRRIFRRFSTSEEIDEAIKVPEPEA